MTPTRRRRLFALVIALAGLGVASAIVVWSLSQNMMYFVSPSDLAVEPVPEGRRVRLGGLVQPGSRMQSDNSLDVAFVVTDGQENVTVHFDDILPDLFQEGQGVIAIGAFDSAGVFHAEEVLAKHDEQYMPPEVADALERAGHPID